MQMRTILTYFVFQLTRSVGSVTSLSKYTNLFNNISTHTLRGERDYTNLFNSEFANVISTHTLRGERDISTKRSSTDTVEFQLTRSVGSVTTISGGLIPPI